MDLKLQDLPLACLSRASSTSHDFPPSRSHAAPEHRLPVSLPTQTPHRTSPTTHSILPYTASGAPGICCLCCRTPRHTLLELCNLLIHQLVTSLQGRAIKSKVCV